MVRCESEGGVHGDSSDDLRFKQTFIFHILMLWKNIFLFTLKMRLFGWFNKKKT